MSFSQQVKKEIVAQNIDATCCVTSACYGVACFGKYFDSRGVVLHTEQEYIAQWALDMFRKAGVAGILKKRKKTTRNNEFAVKDPHEVEKMLALFAHTGAETSLRIKRETLECPNCFAAFTAAAFLCSGVVVDPKKGYLLEFISPRYSMIRDFENILKENRFEPKWTNRKGYNLLYFKASEQIEDLLTTMGASQSSMEIMNTKIYKDFRNTANRITNCETANIDKTVAANRKVLDAIQYLKKHNAWDTLPPALQEAGELRRAYPSLSLAELADLGDAELTKSGLSHRFRNIVTRAEALKTKRAAAKEKNKT